MNNIEYVTKPFTLPHHTMFSISKKGDTTVAHALDFDLVAVGETEAEAVAKIRISVKHYIEHGLRKGYSNHILFSAPSEFWSRLTPDTPISIGEALQIENVETKVRMITQIAGGSFALNEAEHCAPAT